MYILILENKIFFWRGQGKWGRSPCQCLGDEGTVGFFFDSSCRAWGREADWDRKGGTCKCCSFSCTWRESQGGGWATHRGLVGNPLEMPRVGCAWDGGWWEGHGSAAGQGGCGRHWVSALGSSLCLAPSPLRGFAALHLPVRGPLFCTKKGWVGEITKLKVFFMMTLWLLFTCLTHKLSPVFLLAFVPSPAVCSV